MCIGINLSGSCLQTSIRFMSEMKSAYVKLRVSLGQIAPVRAEGHCLKKTTEPHDLQKQRRNPKVTKQDPLNTPILELV